MVTLQGSLASVHCWRNSFYFHFASNSSALQVSHVNCSELLHSPVSRNRSCLRRIYEINHLDEFELKLCLSVVWSLWKGKAKLFLSDQIVKKLLSSYFGFFFSCKLYDYFFLPVVCFFA